MKFKIGSWNVNGLRACHKKGFLEWLNTEKPHILGLQEIKANVEQLPEELTKLKKYNAYFFSAKKAGYSGVALYISKKLEHEVTYGLGIKKFDDEGRSIIAEFEDFILINCYFPNGQRDHGRVPYKLDFSKAVAKKAKALKKKTSKPVIICGDVNTAHEEIDLANPKTNRKTTGFLPIEREWLTTFLKSGYFDAFRKFTPVENGHYTWWTYRGDCRQRNIGWRIDYFLTENSLEKQVKKCYHRPEVLGSDHCPIMLELKF